MFSSANLDWHLVFFGASITLAVSDYNFMSATNKTLPACGSPSGACLCLIRASGHSVDLRSSYRGYLGSQQSGNTVLSQQIRG